MDKQVRCAGALLGLAVGDALGTTLEFRAPGSFVPIETMVGGGPFGLAPGEWTDDTSMAMCLAESLVERGGFDAHDQMERYVRWWKEGHWSPTGRCFDIGNTVQDALWRFLESGEPMAGSTHPKSAGNGSIMRLAPVPIYWREDADSAIRNAVESSRTTHGARTCLDACRYFAGLIWSALNGATKDTLLSENHCPLASGWEQPLCKEIAAIAAGSFKERQPPEIRGTGYVVQSLEAALWAFHNSDDFRTGALLAVNLGDDADTTGAVYGQIAGAFYGETGIPEEWLSVLYGRDDIREMARRCCA